MEDQDDATPVATSGEGIEEEGAGAPLQTEGVDVEAPADGAEALTQNEGVAVDDGQTTLAPPSTPPPREDGGAGAAERSLGADLSAIIDEELAGRRASDREDEDVEAQGMDEKRTRTRGEFAAAARLHDTGNSDE